jgi:hypothetical protein
MASLALASFDVILVGIVWGCLHDGAHSFERELCVRLAGVKRTTGWVRNEGSDVF